MTFFAAVGEFILKAHHIEGVNNRRADYLSRWHLGDVYRQGFLSLMEPNSTEVIVSDAMFDFSGDW